MEVREFKSIDGMDALRRDWDAAFAVDSHASPFMSWAWHRGWIDVTPHPWMVLAARENSSSPFVAFLPISQRGSQSVLRIDHLREVHAGGEPTADEVGFVCEPTTQSRALAALARHLADHVAWDRLRFEEMNDPRLGEFLSHMPATLEIRDQQGAPCPRMPLPATFEQYIQRLSYSTRQSLRKRMRVAESRFRFTATECSAITDGMIEAVVRMAAQRTRLDSDPHIHRLGSMLRRCADAGLARMVTLWDCELPVAGVAGLIDRKRSAWCLYVTSFDEGYAQHSPGRVAIALAIRDAIQMHLATFDFLRGEESYKFQFGGESRHNRTLVIERPTLQAALRRGISGVRESLRI